MQRSIDELRDIFALYQTGNSFCIFFIVFDFPNVMIFGRMDTQRVQDKSFEVIRP